MRNLKVKQVTDTKMRNTIIDYMEKVKNIDKDKIKKILIIGSVVVVIAMGAIFTLQMATGINVMNALNSFIIKEKVIEGAVFSLK